MHEQLFLAEGTFFSFPRYSIYKYNRLTSELIQLCWTVDILMTKIYVLEI